MQWKFCIIDGYGFCVVDRNFLCRIFLCFLCQSYAYFIMLGPRLSVNLTIFLYLYSLVSRLCMGGRQFFLFFLCWSGRAKCLSREQCVWWWMQEQLLCAPVAVCNVSRTVKSSFKWSRKFSECGNKDTHIHECRTPYISLVTELFSIYAQ